MFDIHVYLAAIFITTQKMVVLQVQLCCWLRAYNDDRFNKTLFTRMCWASILLADRLADQCCVRLSSVAFRLYGNQRNV